MSSIDDTAWHIDAWSPRDGIAFASRRPPLPQSSDDGERITAERTVYISAPYFEAEDIGKVATALGATRGHFQFGFYREDEEVAFATLETVIETVKRGYLASGSGSTGPGAPLPVEPAPSPPEGWPGEPQAIEEIDVAWHDLIELISAEPFERKGSVQEAAAEILRAEAAARIIAAFLIDATVPPLLAIGRLEAPPADINSVGNWLMVVHKAGAWLKFNRKQSVLESWFRNAQYATTLDGVAFEVDPWLHFDFTTYQPIFNDRFTGLDSIEVMKRISWPESWRLDGADIRGTGDNSNRPSLANVLFLALGDRRFLRSLDSAQSVVPVLLLLVLAATAWTNRRAWVFDAEAPINGAIRMLEASLGGPLLDEAVEDAIHEFAITFGRDAASTITVA